MKIGIDIREIYDPAHGQGAGVGVYVQELLRELLNQAGENDSFVLFAYADYNEPSWLKRSNIKTFRIQRGRSFWHSHAQLPHIMNQSDVDLLHAPANICPLFVKVPLVLTIHDLAIYLHPEWFPRGQSFATKFLVPYSIRRARRIIAVSRSTKNDLIKLFKIAPEKITVIYEGVRPPASPDRKILNKLGLKEKKYFLLLSTLEPRKNSARLIEAFKRSGLVDEGYQLVLAGNIPLSFPRAMAVGVPGVKLSGLISEAERTALLKNARVFVYPSLYEGFGLPVVESCALATPAIVSNVSSLPEVACEHSIFVDPYDVADIAAALRQAVSEKTPLLCQNCDRRGRFSWAKAARETWEIYRSGQNVD